MKELNPDVIVVDTAIATVTRDAFDDLKRRARQSPKRRARICAHRDVGAPVHEMFIAFASGCYIRPHKHLAKSESYFVVEGRLDLVFFDESGRPVDAIELRAGDGPSYCRTEIEQFHTVVIRSDIALVHETTRGPFVPAESVLAPWAPDEHDRAAAAGYLVELDHSLREVCRAR